MQKRVNICVSNIYPSTGSLVNMLPILWAVLIRKLFGLYAFWRQPESRYRNSLYFAQTTPKLHL